MNLEILDCRAASRLAMTAQKKASVFQHCINTPRRHSVEKRNPVVVAANKLASLLHYFPPTLTLTPSPTLTLSLSKGGFIGINEFASFTLRQAQGEGWSEAQGEIVAKEMHHKVKTNITTGLTI